MTLICCATHRIRPPVIGNLTGPVLRDAARVERAIGGMILLRRPERSFNGMFSRPRAARYACR